MLIIIIESEDDPDVLMDMPELVAVPPIAIDVAVEPIGIDVVIPPMSMSIDIGQIDLHQAVSGTAA